MTSGNAEGIGGRGDGPAVGPALRWEESGGRTLSATACVAGRSGDEIALLFGTAESDDRENSEVRVRWQSRILLRPGVAAQLAAALQEVLRRHEARYGPLGQPARPTSAQPPALLLPTSEVNRSAANLLLAHVRALRTPFGFERSFKLSRGTVQGNRLLATVNKDAVGPEAPGRLTAICRRLEMPDRLLRLFAERLPEATFVHFGFEEGESSSLCKVYLEFWSNWEEELSRRAASPEPFLLHLGLKWDRSTPERCAVTRYTCHPWLPVEEVRRRIGDVYATRAAAVPREAAQAVAGMAEHRTEPGRILFLEVREDDNPRHSFDLNLYKAGLRVRDLDAWISRIGAHYDLPADLFRRVYDAARPLALGHIAGGLDREGRDFLTVYYGMEER